MKVLFVATVAEHINAFHLPYLKWFKEQGWEVHVASGGKEEIPWCDKKHDISIRRSPFTAGNIRAYFQLKKILEEEKFDIIHAHTPVGGLLARICGKKHRKSGTKIIYTAHGFHFYKSAPLINWLLYYPMEKWLSVHTDALITINREDYELAQRKMKAAKVYFVPGVGVDTDGFAKQAVPREEKREGFGLPEDAILIISIGELSKRKNHRAAIEAVSKLESDNLFYLICGRGALKNDLIAMSRKLGVKGRVLLLGYRNDTADLLHMSDVFLFPSIQEGLPVALMEAMAAGLPCVASRIRGNVDLIEDEKGGFLCGVNDAMGYAAAIERLIDDENLRKSMGEYNRDVIKKFDIEVVMGKMKEIYLS